jgi:hypothetical protein
MEYPAKDAWHIGFNLRSLAETYALAGAVEVPEWSNEGTGDPLSTRDDDVSTAWRCTPNADTTCAFGINFPEPASVSAVRLWALSADAPLDHARVERVRVHTDVGWAEVRFGDDVAAAYVIFGRPVETRQLTVEFMSVHPGHKSHEVWLGELEVYGEAGAARPPLSLDATTVIVSHPTNPWTKHGHERRLQTTFLEQLRPDGTRVRIGFGSAIYGAASDRLILVEDMLQTVCSVQKGRYFAIDRQTRMWIPLGDLGGLAADMYRRRAGTGWAAGFADEETPRLEGMLLQAGEYSRHKTQRMASTTGPEYLEQWEMEPHPTPRGGASLRSPIGPCRPADADTIAPLARDYAGKLGKPETWSICELGGGTRAFITDGGGCAKRWEIRVVADAGRVVASRAGKATGDGASVAVRASDSLGLLVDVGTGGDRSKAFVVRSDDIVDLPDGTALAIRPPASCRKRCDEPFVNTRRPD